MAHLQGASGARSRGGGFQRQGNIAEGQVLQITLQLAMMEGHLGRQRAVSTGERMPVKGRGMLRSHLGQGQASGGA